MRVSQPARVCQGDVLTFDIELIALASEELGTSDADGWYCLNCYRQQRSKQHCYKTEISHLVTRMLPSRRRWDYVRLLPIWISSDWVES